MLVLCKDPSPLPPNIDQQRNLWTPIFLIKLDRWRWYARLQSKLLKNPSTRAESSHAKRRGFEHNSGDTRFEFTSSSSYLASKNPRRLPSAKWGCMYAPRIHSYTLREGKKKEKVPGIFFPNSYLFEFKVFWKDGRMTFVNTYTLERINMKLILAPQLWIYWSKRFVSSFLTCEIKAPTLADQIIWRI